MADNENAPLHTESPSAAPPDEPIREAVAFVGETLAPLFLEDPAKGSAGASYAAFASLDASAAANDWPFADAATVCEALSLMRGCLRESGGAPDDDLVWEYRRLFVGPEKKAAPPWGSVYTDRDCVIFGESALALSRWMRAHGIARLTADDNMPDDHIGLMLALMAWIAREKPELLAEYLREHLLTWSGHFLEELEEATAHPFFRGLARLTAASLEGIRETLAIEVTYPRFYR